MMTLRPPLPYFSLAAAYIMDVPKMLDLTLTDKIVTSVIKSSSVKFSINEKVGKEA